MNIFAHVQDLRSVCTHTHTHTHTHAHAQTHTHTRVLCKHASNNGILLHNKTTFSPLRGENQYFIFHCICLIFYFYLFLFCFSRAGHAACGSSQGRGQVRAAAAGLHHSHSNLGSTYTKAPGNAGYFNSWTKARDPTHILMGTSQAHYH